MSDLHDKRVEAAAKALDQNFNPDEHPIMAAMFRDYSRTAVTAFLDTMLDEDALANVIAHAGADWEYELIEYREGKGDDPGPSAEYVTRAVVAYLKGEKR